MKSSISNKQNNTGKLYTNYFVCSFDLLFLWQEDIFDIVHDYIYQDTIIDFYFFQI